MLPYIKAVAIEGAKGVGKTRTECETEEEFDTAFAALSDGGSVMMHEGPFMQFRQVAWVIDKFGVCWQPVLR
jgi:predicted 3-demethylubiquinone-9 3-methyltransferase (glyoxalase superfamily)